MNVLLEEIVTDCAKQGIPVELHYDWTDKKLSFNVHIGSKTGNAIVEEINGEIWVVGRYDRKEQINSFTDLALYAFGWFLDYRDRSPFENPDGKWAVVFEEKGWIEQQKVVTTQWKVKQ